MLALCRGMQEGSSGRSSRLQAISWAGGALAGDARTACGRWEADLEAWTLDAASFSQPEADHLRNDENHAKSGGGQTFEIEISGKAPPQKPLWRRGPDEAQKAWRGFDARQGPHSHAKMEGHAEAAAVMLMDAMKEDRAFLPYENASNPGLCRGASAVR